MARSSPFVGRSAELHHLAETATKTAAGEPWVVHVRGAAGVGKSALVQQLIDTALAGFTILQGSADRTGARRPYHVVRQLVSCLDEDTISTYPLLTRRLQEDIAPYSVGAQLMSALGELQGKGPVAVVVDDVQWADTPSALALSCVLRRLWADSVFTVLITRDEDSFEEPVARLLASFERTTLVDVAGLTPEEIQDLAHTAGHTDFPQAVAEQVRARTHGNALYVQTVLNELLHQERLGQALSQLPVPTSLAESIQGQLASLPSSSRDLVEALAVMDSHVAAVSLGRMAGIDDPVAALESAGNAGLVDITTDPPPRIRLRHALQRDAIYTAIDPARRRHLHAAAAKVADATTVWEHRVAAAEAPDAQLAQQLEALAEAEVGRGEFTLAAAHLMWSAQLSDNAADHERRLLTASISPDAGYVPKMRELKDAIHRCAPSALRSYALGMVNFVSGDLEQANTHLTDAISAAQGDPQAAPVAAQSAAVLSTLNIWLGAGEQAVHFGSRALDSSQLLPVFQVLSEAMVAEGLHMRYGPHRALERVSRLPRSEDVANSDLELLARRADFRLLAGNVDGAIEDASTIVRRSLHDLVPAGGDIYAGNTLAMAQYLAGKWDEALVASERALVSLSVQENPWDAGWSYAVASLVPAARGQWQTAQRHVQEAEGLAAALQGPMEIVFAALAGAKLAQVRRDHAHALACLQPLLALDPGNGWRRSRHMWWGPPYVEALIETGELGRARAALAELEHTAEQRERTQALLGRLRGRLAHVSGDTATACDVYEQALAGDTEEDNSVLDRAWLHYDYGRLLIELRRRQQAGRMLQGALQRFAALGAQPFLNRCNTALASIGLRPAKSATEAFQLNDREREIAAFVARGMTNKEIAAELFVSSKTVEYHLGGIFRKFNLTNRKQLRDLIQSGAEVR
jgi:ATP/maltotriose-dependent transcriptional regulator MalT